MSTLAEYFKQAHPTTVHPLAYIERKQQTHITIPVKQVTAIKGFVLTGIVVSTFIPPQYSWAVIAVTNGYWMFKLK